MESSEHEAGEISAGEGRAAVVSQIIDKGSAPPSDAVESIEEPKKRGRPRKDPNAPPAKKKSGTHATRAQLQAKIAELKKQIPPSAQQADSAPNASSAPAADPAPPSALHDPEVRARFVAGMSSAVVNGSGWLARRRGEHWRVNKLEGDALGAASADAIVCLEDIAPTIAPYLAKAVQLAPLGTFAFVVWGIVGERMEMDAQVANGERERVMPKNDNEVPANFSLVKPA